jgi:hypothetical protein
MNCDVTNISLKPSLDPQLSIPSHTRGITSAIVLQLIVESTAGNSKCMSTLGTFPMHFVVALYLQI